MGCLTVAYTKIGTGVTAKFTRVGAIAVTASPVCGTDIGVALLFDKNGRVLQDKNDLYLIAKS